jgi:hypothetical protein
MPVSVGLSLPAQAGSKRTITVYYHSTSTSTSPTQCGVGDLYDGTVSVTCTFPTSGSFYIYTRVTSPITGAQGALRCTPTQLSVGLAPEARWIKLAATYTGTWFIYNAADRTYSADSSTISIASPSCNSSCSFADFADRPFTGDFALVMKFSNTFSGYLKIISAPGASTSILSMGTSKNDTSPTTNFYVYYYYALKSYGPVGDIGFATSRSTDTYNLVAGFTGGIGPSGWNASYAYGSVSNPLAASNIGGSASALGDVYYRIARSGSTLSVSISGDGSTWYSSPQPAFSAISGNCAALNSVTVPDTHSVLIGFGTSGGAGSLSSPFKSITLMCPFSFPTAGSVVYSSGTLTLTTTGYDTANSSTCTLYYVVGKTYTPIGTGTLNTTGVVTVAYTFPAAGTYTVAFTVTAGSGVTSGYIIATPTIPSGLV